MAREVKQTVKFDDKGTFEAYHSALNWCHDNGYSYGSMQRSNPIALWLGDFIISKWDNLSKEEQNDCHGIIIGDFREGPVSIIIYA